MAQNTIRSPGGVTKRPRLEWLHCSFVLPNCLLSAFLISLTPSKVFLHTKWQDVRGGRLCSGTAPSGPAWRGKCVHLCLLFPLVLSHKMPRLRVTAFRSGNLQQSLRVLGEGDAPPGPLLLEEALWGPDIIWEPGEPAPVWAPCTLSATLSVADNAFSDSAIS